MLPRLNPDPNASVDVQQTEFSHDMLGRWVCSTWSEVSNNGGDPFDVVVIGGGVVGSGAALDAATRGLKVALVEARDLASGTSSRSSKLFHGGLRVLLILEGETVVITRFSELRGSCNDFGQQRQLTGEIAALPAAIGQHVTGIHVIGM